MPNKGLSCLLSLILSFGFHNTSMSESTILVRGLVVPGGVVCPLFRTVSGETLSLTGLSTKEFKQGLVLSLTGRWEAQSVCMQGYPTLRVEHISFKEIL
jgi:hypothetical protein